MTWHNAPKDADFFPVVGGRDSQVIVDAKRCNTTDDVMYISIMTWLLNAPKDAVFLPVVGGATLK